MCVETIIKIYICIILLKQSSIEIVINISIDAVIAKTIAVILKLYKLRKKIETCLNF